MVATNGFSAILLLSKYTYLPIWPNSQPAICPDINRRIGIRTSQEVKIYTYGSRTSRPVCEYVEQMNWNRFLLKWDFFGGQNLILALYLFIY